jgi:hypothetical protein
VTEVEAGIKFEALSPKAKERALEHSRHWETENRDWHKPIFEDAVRIAALLGIDIGVRKGDRRKDRSFESEPCIDFSGFHSQGDGVSFSGSYACAPDAVTVIETETTDEELYAIAKELTAVQVALKLQWNFTLMCDITPASMRSYNIAVDNVEFDGCGGPFGDDINNSYDREVGQLTSLFRRFADWIYSQLETEHEYLTSDEYVTERLVEGDYLFDEDGYII